MDRAGKAYPFLRELPKRKAGHVTQSVIAGVGVELVLLALQDDGALSRVKVLWRVKADSMGRRQLVLLAVQDDASLSRVKVLSHEKADSAGRQSLTALPERSIGEGLHKYSVFGYSQRVHPALHSANMNAPTLPFRHIHPASRGSGAVCAPRYARSCLGHP